MKFQIVMRGGIFLFDLQFRDDLIDTLLHRSSGILINSYDNALFYLDDVYCYEDENGNYVDVNPPAL